MRSTAFILLWLAACAPAMALTPGQNCEKKAVSLLRTCGKSVSRQQQSCVKNTGAMCAATDPKIVAALTALQTKVTLACPDAATVVAAGYPALMTPATLVDRLSEACQSAVASLFARSFGGPHAAVRDAAATLDQRCLDNAYGQGWRMIDYALGRQSDCVVTTHLGRTCDPVSVGVKIAARQLSTATSIARRCADLPGLVAVDPTQFVQRAVDQAGCLVPTLHGQTAPLTLACGPRASVPVPPAATPTQVVLDSATWGTRCGDGSDWAFWIRLPPAGQPIDKVLFFIAGGGSCVDGPTCAATAADLFEATSDTMPNVGIMTSTNATSPFVNWTKVFLPYCTQDQHTGGGIVNAFPEMTVYRYGAQNVRATMRYVRDVLWAAMDASDPEGFRPDRLTVLFSGSSAGGAGAQFNYHYVLDDLRWVHTTLLADSSLGLDNGAGSSLERGMLALGATTPGWGGLPMAPPYCHDATCGEGWNRLMFAQAPRLKAVPEQQIISLTNQIDSTQKAVYEFPNMVSFTNALRTKYCEQKGTNGLHSFLAAESEAIHGNINKNTSYNQISVGGTLMRDWLGRVMSDPDGIGDKVREGTLQQDFPGVLPFPCAISSPSGAFV